ncbi:MAG TPA: calcium/proton exchanger [Trueperaceae bacterium]
MNPLNVLLIFVPVAFVLEFSHASDTLIFGAACLAILPLAGLMGRATEELAVRTGSTIGGLLNATFGNATELIIAFFALSAGKFEVVKASITGSIIGNLLLVLGLALFLGGLRYARQTFNAHGAQVTASLLTISVIAFLVPALFDYTERALGVGASAIRVDDTHLAFGVSLVLIALYAANIVFTLFTHRDLLSTADQSHEGAEAAWSPPVAVGVLLAATVLVGFMSEFLVGSLDGFTTALGLSEFFVGIIIIPIVGNAAEHAAAVLFAMKNKMDLSVTIALGSTVQVALLVAPVLVLLSFAIGRPMDLVLHNPLELITLIGAVLIGNSVARDGETNWLEGLMLLGVYVIAAIAFFFLPSGPGLGG